MFNKDHFKINIHVTISIPSTTPGVFAGSYTPDVSRFGGPIDRVPVNSSALKSVGYRLEKSDRGVLEIEFHGGSVYQFDAVPCSLYRALMAAQSMGRFFAGKIKPYYTAWKITD